MNLEKSTTGLKINTTKGAVLKGTISQPTTSGGPCISVVSLSGHEVAWNSLNVGNTSFAVTGIPAGTYYLRLKDDSQRTKTGWFPSIGSFASAEKITFAAGDTVTRSVTIPKISYEKAWVKVLAVDERGNPVEGDGGTVRNNYSHFSTNLQNGTFIDSIDAGVPYGVEIKPTSIHLSRVEWENGKDTILTAGDTLDLKIVVPAAGAVEGTIRDLNGNVPEITHENPSNEDELSFGVNLSPVVNSQGGSTQFMRNYRIGQVPAGTYLPQLSSFFMNDAGSPLASQLNGYTTQKTDAVAIKNGQTVNQSITVRPVSGMVSGTIALPFIKYGIVFVYAYAPNGTCYTGCFSAFYDDSYQESAKDKFLNMDDDFKAEQEKTATRKPAHFDIPGLPKGDVAIRVVQYVGMETDNKSFVEYWYGNPVGRVLAQEELDELEDGGLLKIPAKAKFVNLATDATWIKNLDFGSTGIHSLNEKSSNGIRSLSSTNGQLNLSYQFEKADGSISIFGINGRKLAEKSLETASGSINWNPGVASGVYVVEISTGSQKISQKMSIH